MPDNFYARLDFYRMLNAGMTSLDEISRVLGVHRGTLWRWKQAYDPGRGPFGGQIEATAGQVSAGSNRDAILSAMRKEALDGSVPAAKLLLTEYQEQVMESDEVLTVEDAVRLIQEYMEGKRESAEG
jgi:hypothetical protein